MEAAEGDSAFALALRIREIVPDDTSLGRVRTWAIQLHGDVDPARASRYDMLVLDPNSKFFKYLKGDAGGS